MISNYDKKHKLQACENTELKETTDLTEKVKWGGDNTQQEISQFEHFP
jgi:hypothetical protein